MKKVVCWGGDRRMQILARELEHCGWRARWQPGKEPLAEEDGADVILPVPSWDKEGYLTGSEHRFSLEEVAAALPAGAAVMGWFSPETAARLRQLRRDMEVLELNREERYLRENGEISARGAIARMEAIAGDPRGQVAVVLGYGHMGRPLARSLRERGAEVVAVGRRGGSILRAREDGIPFRTLEDWRSLYPRADWILNTIAAPVVGEAELDACSPAVRLMELASAPFGIDGKAAQDRGMAYSREPGLPGRIFPEAAAAALAAAWLRMRNDERGENHG